MANQFTRYVAKNVGTTGNTLVTANAATQTTCIGLSVANTISSPISVSVYVTASATNYYLINGMTVAPGGALTLFGSDGKLVLNSGDAFVVSSSVSNSADAVLSVLQIS